MLWLLARPPNGAVVALGTAPMQCASQGDEALADAGYKAAMGLCDALAARGVWTDGQWHAT